MTLCTKLFFETNHKAPVKMKQLFVALCTALVISSCCKEGTNGDATLVVFAKRNGTIIKNHVGYPDTVYVKFNTKDLPGTHVEDFDTYFVGETGEDHVHCEKLKCGDYFLFVAGFDSSINSRVTGGLHIKIKHKERKNEIDTDVDVSF